MTDDQPRDKIGQFASTTHAEASVSLSAQPGFDAEAHAELTAAIRAETFRIDEAKRKLSKMQLDAALSVVRKEFPDAAELELTFSSTFGMNPKAVRDEDGNVLSEGASWTYSAPEGASSVVSHLDQTSQSLFYNGEDGFRYEDETGALLVDVNHRFSTPAEPVELAESAPAAAVLDGFTAAEVEDYLAREQHERQCACDLKDDICYTESYGEHWRHRLGVPDVEGIFDSIQGMAAARDAGKQTA
jgi:hypothetical protein